MTRCFRFLPHYISHQNFTETLIKDFIGFNFLSIIVQMLNFKQKVHLVGQNQLFNHFQVKVLILEFGCVTFKSDPKFDGLLMILKLIVQH